MTTFYHFTPHRWTYGSYLRPGNFGRIISLWGRSHDLYRRETAYESYRAQHCPERPSRLNCLFCLPSRSDAALYRRYIHGYETSFLYEVHTDEIGFVARNDRIAYFGDSEFQMQSMEQYWSGAGDETEESGSWILKEVLLTKGAYVGLHIPVSIEPAPRAPLPA